MGWLTALLACLLWCSAFSLSSSFPPFWFPDSYCLIANNNLSPPIYNHLIMQPVSLSGWVVLFNPLSSWVLTVRAVCLSWPWPRVTACGGTAPGTEAEEQPCPRGKASLPSRFPSMSVLGGAGRGRPRQDRAHCYRSLSCLVLLAPCTQTFWSQFGF